MLAGEAGLNRRVTSVTVGEVPDIADWLTGGELVLSTMFAVRGDAERQRDFCKRVMMADAAALFVKIGRFVWGMPEEILELADKRGFPIVEVPQSLRWTRLMQEVTELIISRQAMLLAQSQAIHSSLLQVVVRGGSWQNLADEAARLLGWPVLLLDASLELLGVSGYPEDLLPELEKSLQVPEIQALFSRSRTGDKLLRLEEPGLPAMFVFPVVASHERLGYVCALTQQDQLSPNQVMTLEHTATVAALEMALDRARFETEVRLKGDFVDQVVDGGEAVGDRLLRRGVFLGCDLSQGAAVILLGIDEADGLVLRKNLERENLDRRIERFLALCTRQVSMLEKSSLVSLKAGRIVVFVCGATAHDAQAQRRLAEQLKGLGENELGLSVSVGMGGFAGRPERLSRGYQEALVALRVARKLQGPGGAMHFYEVGSYRLLLDIWERDPGEIRALYEDSVAPLDRYDEANGSQLLETLQVFFKNNESLNRTAAELHAHRHTIRYRLEKIAEITGLSVLETEHKERLSLGLKARILVLG